MHGPQNVKINSIRTESNTTMYFFPYWLLVSAIRSTKTKNTLLCLCTHIIYFVIVF